MSKYIKREDAEKILTKILYEEPPYMNNMATIEKYSKYQMAELPSIDIVTCGDCKHWKHIEGCSFCSNQWGLYKETAGNDYCVRGEEQEDG